MRPIEDNIEIASRRVTWGGASGNEDWIICGEDLSGAAWVMTAREKPGDTGTPLFQIANAAAGSEGIYPFWDGSYVWPDGVAGGATFARPQIAEATLEAIPWGATPSDQAKVIHYDVLVTPVGLPQQVAYYGTITINPGVGD